MEENMNNKIHFINDNIDKSKNHQNYIKLLNFYNCQYTTNSNGVFVNLNKLNDEIISDFYIRLYNELKNKDNNDDKYEKQIKEIEEGVIIKEKVETKEINKLLIDQFSKEDSEIIELSKKYNI